MNQDIKTFELAKVYENQGYYKDAFEIYSFLNKENSSDDAENGLERMKKILEEEARNSESQKEVSREEKISNLLEKWLNLIILKQKLNNFQRIKSRLS